MTSRTPGRLTTMATALLALGGCAAGTEGSTEWMRWEVDAEVLAATRRAPSGLDAGTRSADSGPDEDPWEDEPDAGMLAPDAGSTDGGSIEPDAGPTCDPALCPGLRCVEGTCGHYPDCQGLAGSGLALASQSYWIHPAGLPAPIAAHCDMSTDGGGWTLVFLAQEDDYDRTLTDYTEEGSRAILARATEALLSFRADRLGRPLTPGTPWARVSMPAEWRTAFPTAFAGEERTVMTFVEGDAAPSPRELVFGFGEFRTDTSTGRCDTGWQTWDVDYGRICIRGTEAPFYSATHSGDVDRCSLSHQSWSATQCSSTRRFSIAVR